MQRNQLADTNPRGSKYLLRRYLDPFLHPKSNPPEVLGPSGNAISVKAIFLATFWPCRFDNIEDSEEEKEDDKATRGVGDCMCCLPCLCFLMREKAWTRTLKAISADVLLTLFVLDM